MFPLVRVPEFVTEELLVIVAVTLSSVTSSETFISLANTDIIVKGPGFMVEVVHIVPAEKPSVMKLPVDLDILLPDDTKVRG